MAPMRIAFHRPFAALATAVALGALAAAQPVRAQSEPYEINAVLPLTGARSRSSFKTIRRARRSTSS
jgi:hypothetical protein